MKPAKLLDRYAVAKMLGIDYRTLHEALARGDQGVPPYIWVGRRQRWHRETVERWLKESEGHKSK